VALSTRFLRRMASQEGTALGDFPFSRHKILLSRHLPAVRVSDGRRCSGTLPSLTRVSPKDRKGWLERDSCLALAPLRSHGRNRKQDLPPLAFTNTERSSCPRSCKLKLMQWPLQAATLPSNLTLIAPKLRQVGK